MSKFLLISLVSLATCMCDVEQYEINSKSKDKSLHDYELGSFVDSIIDSTLKTLGKTELLKPLPLPDKIMIDIDKWITFVHLLGKLGISNGQLRGANSIHRNSDAIFVYNGLSDVVVNCSFYFDRFDFNYEFEINLENIIETGGNVSGNIQHLVANTSLVIDMEHKTVRLTSLKLVSTKSMAMSLEYCVIANQLVNLAFDICVPLLKSPILYEIQKQSQYLLNKKFPY